LIVLAPLGLDRCRWRRKGRLVCSLRGFSLSGRLLFRWTEQVIAAGRRAAGRISRNRIEMVVFQPGIPLGERCFEIGEQTGLGTDFEIPPRAVVEAGPAIRGNGPDLRRGLAVVLVGLGIERLEISAVIVRITAIASAHVACIAALGHVDRPSAQPCLLEDPDIVLINTELAVPGVLPHRSSRAFVYRGIALGLRRSG